MSAGRPLGVWDGIREHRSTKRLRAEFEKAKEEYEMVSADTLEFEAPRERLIMRKHTMHKGLVEMPPGYQGKYPTYRVLAVGASDREHGFEVGQLIRLSVIGANMYLTFIDEDICSVPFDAVAAVVKG